MPECLYAREEAQVERAGDLDGLQGQGGRVERERDRVNHLGVHQQLRALAAVSQTCLGGETAGVYTQSLVLLNYLLHSYLVCSLQILRFFTISHFTASVGEEEESGDTQSVKTNINYSRRRQNGYKKHKNVM